MQPCTWCSLSSYSSNSLLSQQTLEGRENLLSFIVLLLAFLILIINNMMYPYPGNDDDYDDEIRALSNGFAAMDVLDITELIFSDTGCFQSYGTEWLVAFYVALGISAILTTFSAYGLEQQKEEPTWKDVAVTSLNMLFNDALFLFIRATTMYRQGHMYTQSIFALVELISLCIRFGMLCSHCCRDRSII